MSSRPEGLCVRNIFEAEDFSAVRGITHLHVRGALTASYTRTLQRIMNTQRSVSIIQRKVFDAQQRDSKTHRRVQKTQR
uniref:Uncharacterized protein n=1 Tax=Candidatus Kentrum sp. LPFa TaxID=2126335 RepID=A0A450XBI8_9GAMM|nr:MAG: hypothetical protein BECKLPF1236A_GA0070988_1003516 [Candidatus Kentron sp. LPFa]VFK26648.1 MAG: hypothetical protein BECKLPF1236C_GA0070990_1003716 [Candidatus Kentron sp. LPFa]